MKNISQNVMIVWILRLIEVIASRETTDQEQETNKHIKKHGQTLQLCHYVAIYLEQNKHAKIKYM